MVGQLINEFDNSNDQTLGAFNKLFNKNIGGDLLCNVIIGNMLVGGIRELFIGSKCILVDLGCIKTKNNHNKIELYTYKIYYNGVLKNETSTIASAQRFLKCTDAKIRKIINENSTHNGYTIIKGFLGYKANVNDANTIVKKVNRQKNVYTIKSDDTEICFSSLTKLSDYLGIHYYRASSSNNSNIIVKGYKISSRALSNDEKALIKKNINLNIK